MSVWEFDVPVSTHDLLKTGVTEAGWRRVTVEADTYSDASLTAAAMAWGPDDVVVTDIRWRY